jgi:chorismate mutase-like protein
MPRSNSETEALLSDHRRRIDELDDHIVRLLAERFDVVREVARIKAAHDIPVRLPERIQEVCERNSAHGAERGIDPNVVRQIYSQIVDASCSLEDDLVKPLAGGNGGAR